MNPLETKHASGRPYAPPNDQVFCRALPTRRNLLPLNSPDPGNPGFLLILSRPSHYSIIVRWRTKFRVFGIKPCNHIPQSYSPL